jgi:lipopolysaccharide exporter
MSTTGIAARGAAWTIASSVLSRGLSLIGTLILIRFVAPNDYGEVAAATMVIATMTQFTTLGVGVYVIVNRGSTSSEDLFHATLIHIVLGVVAFFGVIALGKPLSPLFDTPNMYRYIPGLAVSALADRIAFMPERILIRDLKFRRISFLRSTGEIVYTSVSVATAALGWGGMSIVIGNIARSAVRGVAMLVSVRLGDWLQICKVRWAVLRKIATYGLSITVGGFASFASRRWDNLLVSHFFGPATMATYNLAYNLADIPAVHIGEQICDVMQASFAHMSPEERRRTLLRSLGVIGLVTFPIAVGLGAVAPTLAGVFLNNKWAGAGAMLTVLSVLSLTRPVFGAVSSFLLIERGPRVVVIIEWLSLAALMGSIATFGRISPLWTCGAVGVTYTLRALAGIYVARASSGISAATFLARLMPPLAACLPMVAVVLGIRYFLPRLIALRPLAMLLVEIALGAVAFMVSAFVLAPAPADDLLSLVRKRRRPVEQPAAVG